MTRPNTVARIAEGGRLSHNRTPGAAAIAGLLFLNKRVDCRLANDIYTTENVVIIATGCAGKGLMQELLIVRK
jgi:hypothetical protein